MKTNKLFNLLGKNAEGKIIKINLEEITTLPELKSAFKMNVDVKDRIKVDISENGFNKAHAVHIFLWEGKWVLCDGHTRYTAAKELGLKSIWAQVHCFETINQALLYSMKEQFNRRNIEDSELFKQFEILRQQEINGKKISVEEMSEKLHKSKRHIFKLQEVFSKSSKEQLKSIREGTSSINQVYNEIKKQESEIAEAAAEDFKKEIEKESEEKASENITSDIEPIAEKVAEEKIKKEIQKKQRELQEKEIELKQKESKLSKRLSDKQILLIGAKFALIQKAKGKTVEEILNQENFADSVKAADISFLEEDLELLKVM